MSQSSKNGTAQTRLTALFDDGVFTEIDAQSAGGAMAAYGSVGGATAFAFCQDAAQNNGAVNAAQARKLARVYDLAAKTGSPVITVYDAKGVSLDAPFDALATASEILDKVAALSGVVPQIAVILGPCGGFFALAAAMADFCVMAKEGEMFLTPAFVDKAKGGKTKDVGKQDFALKSGVVSVGCDSEDEALAKAAALAGMLPLNNLSALPVGDFSDPQFSTDVCPIDAVCDVGSAVEVYARMGKGSRTVLATIGGTPCGVIGNHGELDRGDSAKCARLVEICDAFNLPVVSLIDTAGFIKSADNDLYEGIRNAARLSQVMADATTAKISVATGSAIGSIYSVFFGSGCDMTYAWNGAVISPLEPETAVGVLWEDKITQNNDIASLAAEYAATEATAQKAAEAGAVGDVIEPADTRRHLIGALDMLASKRVSRLPKKHGNMPL